MGCSRVSTGGWRECVADRQLLYTFLCVTLTCWLRLSMSRLIIGFSFVVIVNIEFLRSLSGKAVAWLVNGTFLITHPVDAFDQQPQRKSDLRHRNRHCDHIRGGGIAVDEQQANGVKQVTKPSD